MAKMTVHMFGLMYFDVCAEGKATVLLPDATGGDDHAPPHYASLFVERSHYESHQNWPVRAREIPIMTIRSQIVMVPVLEFRIARFCDVTFPADQQVPNVDARKLRQALVHMSETNPEFEPDLDGGGSIARVKITSGTVEAFTFNRNVNAVQWTIDSGPQPLRITAGNGSLVLKPRPDSRFGAEVVFSNIPDYLEAIVPGANAVRREGHDHAAHGRHGEDLHHFSLFRKIDRNNRPPNFPEYRTHIEYRSSVMAALEDAVIQSDCTPPCCAK